MHDDIYRLDLGPIVGIHSVFYVSKLKKFHEDECHLHDVDTVLRPSDIEDVWGMQLGKIASIVHKQHFSRKGMQYQIIFEGYPPSEKKWISKHLLAHYPELVAEYEAKIGDTQSGTTSTSKCWHKAFG